MQVKSVDRSSRWCAAVPDRPVGVQAQSPRPSQTPGSAVHSCAPADEHRTGSLMAARPDPVPDTRGLTAEFSNADWTIKPAPSEKPQDPPPEPMYQRLLEQLQSMWRASGNAVDVIAQASQSTTPHKRVQEPIVYPDPKARKVSSV